MGKNTGWPQPICENLVYRTGNSPLFYSTNTHLAQIYFFMAHLSNVSNLIIWVLIVNALFGLKYIHVCSPKHDALGLEHISSYKIFVNPS